VLALLEIFDVWQLKLLYLMGTYETIICLRY